MALIFGDNLSYKGRKPLDERFIFQTIEEMQNFNPNYLPPLAFAQCLEDKKFWVYDENRDGNKWIHLEDELNLNDASYENKGIVQILKDSGLIIEDGMLSLDSDKINEIIKKAYAYKTDALKDISFKKESIEETSENEESKISDKYIMTLTFCDDKTKDVDVTDIFDVAEFENEDILKKFSVNKDGKLLFNNEEIIAKNVFTKDLVMAGSYTSFGNFTKGKNETKTMATKGKTAEEVFEMFLTKEVNPTATLPSVAITFNSGSYEVGSSVTPTYSLVFNPGLYTFNATGITCTKWAISDGITEKDTSSGSFNAITIEDNTDYSINVKAEYTDGAIPITNLDNDYPSVKILGGTITKTSNSIKGYRAIFYGARTEIAELNSNIIRALGGHKLSNTFNITIPEGAKQVIIALPLDCNKELKECHDVGAFGTDIVGSFNKITVNVNGANSYIEKEYNVWVYQPAAALSSNTYEIVIG